jgi:methionyl-tRNA formyltransferase
MSAKYVFFGTPRFAEIVLDGLIRAGMPPTTLISNPDRPVGRKKLITPPPTKVLAEKYNDSATQKIDIFQPEKLDDSFIETLRSIAPDFAVVAAYAKILPKTILDVPRLGTLGTHPSLLPKYRGASPIQSTILAGETETGATIYLMDEKTDHGPVLAQESLIVSEVDYPELEQKLAELSSRLLVNIIPDFLGGNATARVQAETRATYTKKFTTDDGYISPEDLAAPEKAIEIARKIRALNPEPGAWTTRDGKRIKLLKATLENNLLVILEAQKEGEKPKSLMHRGRA